MKSIFCFRLKNRKIPCAHVCTYTGQETAPISPHQLRHKTCAFLITLMAQSGKGYKKFFSTYYCQTHIHSSHTWKYQQIASPLNFSWNDEYFVCFFQTYNTTCLYIGFLACIDVRAFNAKTL